MKSIVVCLLLMPLWGSRVLGLQPAPDVPVISIADAALVLEGRAGTSTNVALTVSLSHASTIPISVRLSTSNGTGVAGSDFRGITNLLVNISPGQTNAPVTVTVLGDALSETNETFYVELSNPSGNVVLGRSRAQVQITDDDPVPAISIARRDVVEGNSGTTTATFGVSLSAPSGQTVRVNYATDDDTAKAGSDYQSRSDSVFFPPGVTNASIFVSIIGDLAPELLESFRMRLSNPVNATLAVDTAQAIILDDDPFLVISINDVSVFEGTGGMASAVFTVNLSFPSGQVVKVNYATANGTAEAGRDFSDRRGTLIFEPGVPSQRIEVPVTGDAIKEFPETFLMTLSEPENATVAAKSQGIATIIDDDLVPAVSIRGAEVAEGNLGLTNLEFVVALSAPADYDVLVTYATADGSAVRGLDYVASTRTEPISAGATNITIRVPVFGDTLHEGDETLQVRLISVGANATIAVSPGQGVILNDDPLPTISINDVAITEANANAVFTVSLSAPSAEFVTVGYETANDAATASDDYVARSGVVTFQPGETQKPVVVTVRGDRFPESDETFFVNLSNPNGAQPGKMQGLGLILNDDPPVPENHSPTISDINNLTLAPNSTSPAIAFSVWDQETPANDLKVVASSSNPDLMPVRNIVFGGSGTNRTVTLTPIANQSGESSITVSVFDADGGVGSDTFLLTVLSTHQTTAITWANPRDIFYGTPLSAAQLNATLDLPGIAPAYTPPAGTILAAGNGQRLTVAFKDNAGGILGTTNVLIQVLKAPLTVTANDQTKPYGAAIPVLDATVNGWVNGDSAASFQSPVIFNTRAATNSPAGLYPIEVSGAAAANYEIRFVPGILTITKATPIVRWEKPSDIKEGPPLTSAQLNATANVPGTFTFTPTLGALLPVGERQKLEAFFVPTDRQNYEPVLTSVLINVQSNQPAPPVKISGDLNADGQPDLVLQDDDGHLAVWFMQGPILTSGRFLNPGQVSDRDYRIVATGDFNGDFQEDLLFQHENGTLAVWFMNGVNETGASALHPSHPGDRNWRVIGTADLNRDGNVDLAFQHTDGTMAVWYMKGIHLDSAALFNPSGPSDIRWKAAGTGDFNADGKADLLLQHSDGTLAIWHLDGIRLIQGELVNPSTPGDAHWRVVSTVDRDQDGQPDLLFRHEADGTLAVWFMEGARMTRAMLLDPPNPGGSWKVVAP